MKYLQKYLVSMQFISIGLVISLVWSMPVFSAGASVRNPLESVFHWFTMDYQNGKYRETLKNLEVLLSYFEDDDAEIDLGDTGSRNLKGKILLLMGAAFEKLENPQKAREYYRKSLVILKKGDIEGIDLSVMKEYQREIESFSKSKTMEAAEPSPEAGNFNLY